MSDWIFLNKWRCRQGRWATTDEDGFMGLFLFPLPGVARRIQCIASDGRDAKELNIPPWEHVSVTFMGSRKTPSWEIMCKVKELFWPPNAWVIQFHPPAAKNISIHDGCLHLWRCCDGREQPIPDEIMV